MILNCTGNIYLGQATVQDVYYGDIHIWPIEDYQFIYFVEDNNEVQLVNYIGDGIDIRTPRRIGGGNTTSISDMCFNRNENIESVIINNGITEIY